MPWTDVIRHLGLCINKPKGESRPGIDPLDEIVEITAPDRDEPRSSTAGQRSFAEKRCTGATQPRTPVELVAAAFAGGKVNLGSHTAPSPLGIAPREQRHTAE